jgi:hypothetical protein
LEQAAATDASQADHVENILREISDISGIKFVKDDPILFSLASILSAIEQNKTEVQPHKKEILKINKEILNLLKVILKLMTTTSKSKKT